MNATVTVTTLLYLAVGMIEFAMPYTAPGTHALNIARRDHRHVAHAVPVCQLSREHVADDLHVSVAVTAEAGARIDTVFIDDAQVPPTHILGVVVLGK